MCGIAGFVNFSGHRRDGALARVRTMADTLVHRGPDEEGFFVDDHAALGHRRLSIIDLGSGQQPMAALDGRLQIVFNGEIYNFQELRRELEISGCRFTTHSDTEVILQGYSRWGQGCIARLHGMFALAIWDTRDQSLFLARDRVGKKPLYYCRQGDTFAFASEIKALRAAGLCPDEIALESLDCYLTFGYVPAPRTIYRGVHKLQAARQLRVSRQGQAEKQYWQLVVGEPVSRPMSQVVEEFEALLDQAVSCRLISEVPLGAFLSGGLDSSLVVASMARQIGRPVITNSIGFDDPATSELPIAQLVAEHLRTEHHEFVVKPDAADVLQKIAWHFDEPVADSSALPTWYVCKMARQTVTVALSGDGGDEAFGGYTFRYTPHVFESRIRAGLPPALRSMLFGVAGAAWPSSAWLPRPLRLKTILENLATSDAEAFYRDLAWLRPDTRSRLYTSEFKQSLMGFTPMEAVAPYYLHNDAPDALGRAQFADIHFYMTDDVLAKVDRMSMAHSLEVRSPLLDHRILEFAARLPSQQKLAGGKGKLVLRELAARRLPGQLLKMPKRGFAVPAAKWLRGELRTFAGDALMDVGRSMEDVIDRRQLQQLWNEHQNGSRDHNVLLWGVLMLGLWRAQRSGVAGCAA